MHGLRRGILFSIHAFMIDLRRGLEEGDADYAPDGIVSVVRVVGSIHELDRRRISAFEKTGHGYVESDRNPCDVAQAWKGIALLHPPEIGPGHPCPARQLGHGKTLCLTVSCDASPDARCERLVIGIEGIVLGHPEISTSQCWRWGEPGSPNPRARER